MKKSIYHYCTKLYELETKLKVPEKECLTYRFGDHDLCVYKYGVTEEQIKSRLGELWRNRLKGIA